jgi:crotonobetainyl-CoA:carnitine CoA-transferase CaiB-like acyl-CoA transferase
MTPVQTFRTRDGWIYIMCMLDKFWDELIARMERPDLGTDPKFTNATARRENRAELTRLLDAELQNKTTAEWLTLFAGAIPVAPVYDVAQAFANPFVAETGMVRAVPHPAKNEFRMLANPLKIDGVRPDQKVCSPLGGDNEALLGPARPQAAAE